MGNGQCAMCRMNGTIPDSIGLFKELYYLDLSNNSFTGDVPAIEVGNLTMFNVSNNDLTGPIPESMARFGAGSFLGNPGLCGAPLAVCAGTLQPASSPVEGMKKGDGFSTVAIVGVAVGGGVGVILAVIMGLVLFCCVCRRKGEEEGREGREVEVARDVRAREKGMENSVPVEETYYSVTGEKLDRSKLVFFDEKRYAFDLEDLLRASAEVLGKGSVGTAYKAILEDGTIMAVKRLKDVTTGRKEFEAQIQVVGKMQHRNVVPLRAYYFSKDEKLLVYDFMQMGSLSALLHGKGLQIFSCLICNVSSLRVMC
jgi:hypothetical protein